jgi:hypothetical protein
MAKSGVNVSQHSMSRFCDRPPNYNQEDFPSRKRCTSQASSMSNFGSFNKLSNDEQRRLLYARDKDNRGSHLTQDEEDGLINCLQAYTMPIISHQEFTQDCLRAYGKEPGHAKEVFDDPRRNVKDVPACVFYSYEPNKFPQEL